MFLEFYLFYIFNYSKIKKKRNKDKDLKKKSEVINGTGKRGIRTLGTNNSYNGLAIRRFSPLSHLSQLRKDNYYVTLHNNTQQVGLEKKSFFIYFLFFYLFYYDIISILLLILLLIY